MTTFYSYAAINALSSGDTGHFVYLDSWSISLLGSMLSQGMPLYFWENDQNPLTTSERDDLEQKLANAGNQLMQSLCGLIMPVCTASIPVGTLLCDGATYNRVDYPNLYDALDEAYHLDTDTFFVPDLRDRFVLGTGPTYAKNTSGGTTSQTLTIDQMPAHTHGNAPHTHTEVTSVPSLINGGLEAPASAAQPAAGVTGATSITIDSAGGGEAFEVIPPYLSLRYVVVAL